MKTGSLRARVALTTLAVLAIVAFIVGATVAVGVAWAAIPGSATGTITACYPTSGASKGVLRVIDEQAGLASRAGSPLDLTPTELRLLAYLVRQRGLVLSKHQLLTQVWGYDAYDPNVVEVHVSALRRKLEAHGPRILDTIRGLGYRLDPR